MNLPEAAPSASDAPSPRLSFAQERLWIIDRLVDDKALYNTAVRFALDGPLDARVLLAALQEVIDRHEVLRTAYAAEDGRPTVLRALPVELPVEDLRGHADAEGAARRHQRATAALPFDLARPPLLRWVLYRFGEERHELLLCVHHIVFDGASVDVLMQELAQLYPALLAGRAPDLPALPQQAADAAAHERARLADGRRERLLAHWRAQLSDDPPLLTLPGDHPRPRRQSFRGGSLQRTLPAALAAALEATCRKERVTPFMVMLAAYAAWLCRHAGQQDVVIGSPFALRGDKDVQRLIGFFVNTVALRMRCEATASFRELLQQARRACLQAYEHAELPFGELVAALGADREPAHPPLCQAMLVVQSRRQDVTLAPGLRFRCLGEVPMDRARFDLSLVLDFVPGGPSLWLEYNADLFGRDIAERMLDRFLVLLDGGLAAPDTPTGRLPLCAPGEQERLAAWAQADAETVPDCGVHVLFRQVAQRQPDAAAVRAGARRLSYRELDALAARIAARLRAEGVGAGALVALCLRRSPEQVATVLALWQLGAAYVPIDPEQPVERQRYIAHDAGVRLVVAEPALRERFAGLPTCCLEDTDAPAADPAPPASIDGAALAYVIYTSGSTGEPKGVLVEHRAVSRLLGDAAPLGYDRDTVMLQSVNPAFDASVLETWGPLCCGGTLVLYPGQSADVAALPGLISEYGINTVTLPASLLDLWVDQLRGPTGLSRIVVGGEALSPATLARLYALDPVVVAINHYGPTENGILTSCYPVPRAVPSPVPIGWPVPGTRLLVLDAAGAPQPEGVVGELYVAGQGVARGYLRRDELTAERFVTLPGHGGVRAYRTGDLVRWRAAEGGRALLEFVGRGDQQVKLRGFRIELGEIEAQLRACPGVQDARAFVHRTATGERQLVAWVAGAGERADWRRRLQDRLPAYMLPAAFVRVPGWPLTPNGKVDRKALPEPQREDYTERATVAPQTPLQVALLAIWQDLLRLDRIGIDDDFFDLGGHSLLATRLHNRVRAELGIDFPLRAVFEAPTIRGLAVLLEAAADGSDNGGAERPGIAPRPTPMRMDDAADAPLSHAQQRLWFVHQFEPDSAQYHIPCRLRLRGPLDVAALARAFADLVARQTILATVFDSSGDEPRQRVLPQTGFDLPLHDLSALPAQERQAAAERRLREEAARPFDLERMPPLRACLLRLAADEHWLAITVHHIAADGWAMAILLEELSALYAARRDGRPSPLPPLPLQYADYAHWQRRWLDEAALEPQFAYWQSRLAGLPLLHNLPLDRPRPPVQGYRGALHRQALPAALVEALGALAKRHDATLFMALHAAFAVLLSRWSGETDIAVGTPVANRRDEAVAPLVGLFINTLVLRSDLADDPSFADLLARSREDALAAFEHQDLPFELLVERLNPPRSSAYAPLFQVLFALQNNTPEALALPDVDATPIAFTERLAKFDLALNLVPDGDALAGEWEYNADLFDAGTVAAMADAYRTLLEAIISSPDCRASRLPLLDAAQRRAALAFGNDTERAYPDDLCVHALFEREVARDPRAVALVHDGGALSRDRLNREANRLAHHLRGLGVGPDVPVAIVMERGPALVAALLAVLKAGGGYVPLDPGQPAARLAAMLTDCRPPVLLTDAGGAPAVRAALDARGNDAAPRVLDLDADAAHWASAPDTNPAGGAQARHLAYAIYTSGSTGQPKGVMNEHGGIVNRLLWMQEFLPLTPETRFLQVASPGFGAAVVEILWPLAAGARLVLAGRDGHKDPAYLVDTIRRERIGILHFVPSMLQAFLDHPAAARCESLHDVLCGGESLPGALARRCLRQLPQARLHHLFGCSEAAVLATGWTCPADGVPDNPPIGRPGANTRIHLLDAHGEPVPRGVRGEIHIAGRQVARGYIGRPELDAERFLADPFDAAPGARMYRSGDLGRRLADGSIEHLGRNDFQVKIRGQRVELGEIEAQLLALPGIRQAVVLARADGHDVQLAAYVVVDDADEASDALAARLRRQLQERLPAHMLPACFVPLPRFPLNANGKLDRAALPAPDAAVIAGRLAAPEDDVQRALLTIWQELLRHSRIGVDCDFFEVGGHSLLALRLVNRVREAFGFELELKVFFATPTIRAVAAAIQRQQAARRAAERFAACDSADIVEF